MGGPFLLVCLTFQSTQKSLYSIIALMWKMWNCITRRNPGEGGGDVMMWKLNLGMGELK